MKKLIATTCSLLFISLPAFAAPLSGDEIRKQIIGKKLSWVTNDGFKGTARHGKNGKSKLTQTAPSKFKDKGTWKIKGNKLCSTWTEIRGGKEGCTTFTPTGNRKEFRFNDGVAKVGGF